MFNAFQQQRSSSPSPSHISASISPSADSDLIFSMSPLMHSPISSPHPQNRLLKRTSASSTIIPTAATIKYGSGGGSGTARSRVRESHIDGSPLPALPKSLFPPPTPKNSNSNMRKDTRGSENGCDFMYSLPRSFTPHPLLKRAATVRPSVSISTQTQAHNASSYSSSKTLKGARPIQKETTPTPTRLSRSSTTPKPRVETHSNTAVIANTNTNSSNTRLHREAYPSPPTSSSPSPPSSLHRASFESFELTAVEDLEFGAGVAVAGETTPPNSRALSLRSSHSSSPRLSSSSLFASYYEKQPQSSLSSEWSQSFYSHSRSRSASNSTSTSASGSMSSVSPIPIPHTTARRSVSDSYLYLTNSSSASRSRSSQNKCTRGRSSAPRVYQPTMMKTSVVAAAPQPMRNELPSGFWASEDGLEPEQGQQEEELELEPEERQYQHVVAPLSPLPSFRESSHNNGDSEMRGRSWGRVGVVRASASTSSTRMETEEGVEMGLELEYDVSGLRSAFEHSDDDDGEYYGEEQAEPAAVAWYDDEEGDDEDDEERTAAPHEQEGNLEEMPNPAEQCGCHVPHCHPPSLHQSHRHRSPMPMQMHMHDQLDFGLDFDLNSTLVEGASNRPRPIGWAHRAHLLVPTLASAMRG